MSGRLRVGVGVLVAAVAMLAVAGLLRLRARSPSEEGQGKADVVEAHVAMVMRGRLTETLHLTGTLKTLPNREARISAQLEGRITDLRVRRGDSVRAGQHVATLYNADLAASAQQARAARQTAQHESQQARAGAAFGRETQDAQLREAQAALSAAQARLDALRAGSRPEDIAEARAALAREQADLRRLQSGSLPLEIEQAAAALTAAQTALQTAQEQLKLLREGTRTEEVQAQEAKVREAQAALQLARNGPRPEEIEAQKAAVEEARQALAKLEAGPRAQEIHEAEAEVDQARAALASAKAGKWRARSAELGAAAAGSKAREASASLAAAEAQLGRTEITSPVSGVVAAVFVNQGEVISVGEPIVQVVNARALRVVAQVPAAYQALVHVGLPATVTFPHLPGEKVETDVEVVGAVAGTETGLLPIELFVPNDTDRLADGMATEIELPLDRLGEVVLAPSTAIFSRAGERHVYVLDAENKAHERLVETGAEAGGKLEVQSGLKEGERIITDGTFSIADGVEVKPLP